MKPTNSKMVSMEEEKKREKEKTKKKEMKKKLKPRKYVPNPLFEEIFIRCYKRARADNKPVQYQLALAYKSLYYCPLKFETPEDCLILENFPKSMCKLLEKLLIQKNSQQSTSNLPGLQKQVVEPKDVGTGKAKKPAPSCDPASSKKVIPTIQKNEEQSFAILTALHDAKKSDEHFVTTRQLEYWVSTSLDKFGTVIVGLTSRGLVSRLTDPVRYGITDKGISVLKSQTEGGTNKEENLKKKEEESSRKRKSEEEAAAEKLKKRKEEEQEERKRKKEEEERLRRKEEAEERVKELAEISTKFQRQLAAEKEKLKKLEKEEQIKKRNEEAKLKNGNDEAKLKKGTEESKLEKGNEEAKPKRKKEEPKTVAKASSSKSTENESSDQFVLEPFSFDVIMLVDTQETNAKSKDGSETKAKLERLKTRFAVQHLNVSDFAWIARCRKTQKELTLPFAVERKRIDDLSGSIKDGRYHEQKFRLKRCGIKNITYLVEGMNSKVQTGIPLSSLQQATVNSLVQDGFTLKFTNKHTDSMRYLSQMTTILYNEYKNKRLVSCRKSDLDSVVDTEDTKYLMVFEEFNKASTKNKVVRVKEMFVRQLAQLKGLSIDKALEITKVYPTPSHLKQALLEKGEECLSSLKVNNRKLGDSVSRSVYQLYTQDNLN